MGKHRNRKVDLKTASYELGYGKPPKAGQFSSERQPKNRSSAKGKPRQEKTLDYFLEEAMNVPQKDGTTLKLTRRELSYRNLANKAASGDLRAIKVCEEHARRNERGEEADPLIFDSDLRKQVLADYEAEIAVNLEADREEQARKKTRDTRPETEAGGKTDG